MVRRSFNRRFLLAVTSVMSLLILSGCYDKLTGGGWMASSLSEGAKANFAINVDVTDPDAPRVNGTYDDKGSNDDFPNGVRISLTGLVSNLNDNDSSDPCTIVIAEYVSQDQRNAPGGGEVGIVACDLGEPGAGAGDGLAIDIHSGPYAGYINDGPILGGNFQGHSES